MAVTKKTKPIEENLEEDAKAEPSGLHFMQGSLFASDGNSSVLFSGSFYVEELHELIELAKEQSIEPEKVRVKIFDVDEKYQTARTRRVRLCFAGLQPKKQFTSTNKWRKQ